MQAAGRVGAQRPSWPPLPRPAAEHGHLLPPATAVRDGYPVGTWTKNTRTVGRLAAGIAARREQATPGRRWGARPGALTSRPQS